MSDALLPAGVGSDVNKQRGGRPSPQGRPSRISRSRRRFNWRMALEIAFFTAPALLLLAIFIVWPMLRAVEFSFYRWRGFGELTDFVGLRNYVSVLSSDVFIGALSHNLFIVAGSIVLQLPLGIAIALLLNQRMKFQGIVRTIVFVPYVLAEVIAGVVWLQLLQPRYGVIDTILAALHIPTPAQGFLGTPEYALMTVLVVLTWKYLGLAIILFLAGLAGIPDELQEAAQIDGASWWKTQWHVVLPLLSPTLKTWGFLSMVGSLQLFDMVWILTKGGPANATTTMATFLINEGTQRSNYGIAGAASVILFAIALILALLYQTILLRKDHTAGDKRKGRR